MNYKPVSSDSVQELMRKARELGPGSNLRYSQSAFAQKVKAAKLRYSTGKPCRYFAGDNDAPEAY